MTQSILTFSIAIILGHAHKVIGQANCPEGWLDGSSVDLGCILPDLSYYNVDWMTAMAVCSGYAEGARLLEIYNIHQQIFLTKTMRQIEDDIEGFDTYLDSWWIGLNDIEDEGNLVWPDAGPANFTWVEREDGDGNSDVRDCMTMQSSKYYLSTWYAYFCFEEDVAMQGAIRPLCQIPQ